MFLTEPNFQTETRPSFVTPTISSLMSTSCSGVSQFGSLASKIGDDMIVLRQNFPAQRLALRVSHLDRLGNQDGLFGCFGLRFRVHGSTSGPLDSMEGLLFNEDVPGDGQHPETLEIWRLAGSLSLRACGLLPAA